MRASRLFMTTLATIASVLVLSVASPSPLRAQWLEYPTAGVPRMKDGAPNLNAPAPLTRQGRPDLSGIWYAAEIIAPGAPVPLPPHVVSALFGDAGAPPLRPCPPHEENCITQESVPPELFNIGGKRPGGLPYQPWAAELVLKRAARMGADDPHARCLPPNYPRAFVLPQHKKIVQTPDLLVLLHEFNASYRQVFLDGRPLPTDPNPSWNGYSTGHWEKNTLVVETIGFRDDDLWLDLIGSPLTEAARVTERFQRINYGTLRIEVTVDDPKAYTKPWTAILDQRLVVDTELLDDICLENERSVRLLTPE
jgi:hypothetical protein